MHPLRTALCGLLLAASATAQEDGYFNSYCSSENTGSNYPAQYNIYNSMGSCSTRCRAANYAFAVLQWKDCWCSNYIPAVQISVSQCNQACPGYGSDECGNLPNGLFGYVLLNRQPLGTAGASPSPTKSTQSSTPTPNSPVPSSSSTPSSAPSSPTSTSSPAGTTHVTISEPGTTQTVTTTPTVIAPGSSTDQPSLESKSGLSSGATAGIVVGTLVGAAAVILGAFFLWRRRRSGDDESGTGSTRSPRSPKRKGSVLSRTGLLGGARPQSMTETNYDDPFNDSATHSNSVRHSMMFGAGAASSADGVQTTGPLAPASSRDGSGSERRPSRPLVYDQRLNPSALFANFDNGSRVSMQDQNDYSRPLGVANPDFRYSFDSR